LSHQQPNQDEQPDRYGRPGTKAARTRRIVHEQIEDNTRGVLERETGRPFGWQRIAITEEQAAGITPIRKTDGRDGREHDAWEVEALGQRTVIEIVRSALGDLLPVSLEHVHERGQVEREQMREILERLDETR
jgi:hypothetical protein